MTHPDDYQHAVRLPKRALRGWVAPNPPGGWTADMLDDLPPEAPQHLELINGSLVVPPSQTVFHMYAIRLLERGLVPPGHLFVAKRAPVTLGRRLRPEPDVLLVSRPVTASAATSFVPSEVHLVVEVVSAFSENLDRAIKPPLYANAGIAHFWRVEKEGDTLVAHTYELDPDSRAYTPTGVHHGRLRTDIGFPVDIDLDV
ncbi:Uma2 family endonuclease [Nonomuraea rhizosphaerae]|uniref:Uma2 family endonuclease n=1 Tax=Nonomuraea rhizosphaerae TaxID=2665663 RepID=UPI0027E3356E|nr:Uma2 family endonuclease [Nonomuraea rhizosphaerae]